VFLLHLLPSCLGYPYRRATRSHAVRVIRFPLRVKRRRLRLWPIQFRGCGRRSATLRVDLNVISDVAGGSGSWRRAEATDWATTSECRVLLAGGEAEGTTGGEWQAQLRCVAKQVGIYYVEREHANYANCRSIAIGPLMTTPHIKRTIGRRWTPTLRYPGSRSPKRGRRCMASSDSCLAFRTRFHPCNSHVKAFVGRTQISPC
jgi:hypothetical protein